MYLIPSTGVTYTARLIDSKSAVIAEDDFSPAPCQSKFEYCRIWLGNAWPLSNLTIPKLWLTENLLWIQFIPILINNTRSAHFWPGTRVTSDCSVEPLSRQQQLDTCVLQQSLGNCCQSDSLGQCHAARTGLHSPWQVVRWHRKYVDIDRSLCVSTYLPLPRS